MGLLKSLKFIRLKENIIRIIPIIILLINFYYGNQLFLERNVLRKEYDELQSLVKERDNSAEIVIKDIESIDNNALEILLYITQDFDYERVDVKGKLVTFEFSGDGYFAARDFERVMKDNKYEYILELAQGEDRWSGIRIGVTL